MLAAASGGFGDQIIFSVVGACVVAVLTWIGTIVGKSIKDKAIAAEKATEAARAAEAQKAADIRDLQVTVKEVHKTLVGEPATDLNPRPAAGLVTKVDKVLDDLTNRYVTVDGPVIMDLTKRMVAQETWQTGADQWRQDAEREWKQHTATHTSSETLAS